MAERSEGKSRRGFASMDEARQREIASKGGRAAHAKGTAHEFDSSEARAAGRKGGEAVSRNRDHMAAIGRKGGEARGNSARTAAARGASGRQGSDASRSGETVRGTASEMVRGENVDTIRSNGRTEQGRATPRMNDQDRTDQLRADEFPADQARTSGRDEREGADSDRGLRSRDVPGPDNRI
jgi:general stress protein YciG